ncbi:MAG: carbonic anhydrase [Planctomycetota bacterium]
MSFCTAINCMDGRVQLPVIKFLQDRFGAEYVDSVTEAGPVRYFAGCDDKATLQSILTRVEISVGQHGSSCIAACSHAGCAGNPADDATQQQQLGEAVTFIKDNYPKTEVIGLWIDSDWQVHEMY